MINKELNKEMISKIANEIDKNDIVKFINNNKLEFFRYCIACIKKENYFDEKRDVEYE